MRSCSATDDTDEDDGWFTTRLFVPDENDTPFVATLSDVEIGAAVSVVPTRVARRADAVTAAGASGIIRAAALRAGDDGDTIASSDETDGTPLVTAPSISGQSMMTTRLQRARSTLVSPLHRKRASVIDAAPLAAATDVSEVQSSTVRSSTVHL